MDLLRSLNVDDLPEQQTRFSHLLKQSPNGDDDYQQEEEEPSFDLRLGFDACCVCGKKDPQLECRSCRRVKYCSESCRLKDTSPSIDDENDNYYDEATEQQALGHTSVICAVLNLCNDDEIVEGQDYSAETISSLDKDRRLAATDRLVSEFESYPATLANVIMEGQPYQEALRTCSDNEGSLTIHVIGASQDSELWQGHPTDEEKVWEGYADALAEVAEQHTLEEIRLLFFGPELPSERLDKTIPIPPVRLTSSSAKLLVQTHNSDYEYQDATLPKPDIVVFFNPGFTCPDYSWEASLAFMKCNHVPFLVATNTEMECMADIEYLMDRQFFVDIPAGLRSMLLGEEDYDEDENCEDENGDESLSFFSLNPYSGLRVRQSGTMANDLYVKSRWIFGGISGDDIVRTVKSKKRTSSTISADDYDGSKRGAKKWKNRTQKGSGNSKASNPALI